MIRRTRLRLVIAVAGTLSIVVGVCLASAGPAAAAGPLPLPICSLNNPGIAPDLVPAVNQPGYPPHCWYTAQPSVESDMGSTAGYLGGNDNHTHYRFVTADLTNNTQLIQLNGPGGAGTVGLELCDPNDHAYGAGGWAAQMGLFGDNGTVHQANIVFYAAGFWPSGSPDPCVTNKPLVPAPFNNTNCPPGGTGSILGLSPNVFCGSFPATHVGDLLADFAIYYVPFGAFEHQISFGYLDVTQGQAHQAYTHGIHGGAGVNLWEFGIGAFNEAQNLGAIGGGGGSVLETFANTRVTCYSCSGGPVSITLVQPVNSSFVGGLEEGQTNNVSGQVTMSPENSLAPGGFTLYNGSTSAALIKGARPQYVLAA